MRPRATLLVRNGVSHDGRVLRSAALLRDLGYDVQIVGSVTAAARARSETRDGMAIRRLRARSPLGPLVRRMRRPQRALTWAHRALTALDWQRRALGHLLALRPQLVHANDHNTMWSACAAKLLTGARVVYDSHELWADRNGRWEWRRGVLMTEWCFVRVADAVITASPGYAGVLGERNGVTAPTVIRNLPDRTVSPAGGRDARECVYVGGLMPGRGLEEAILALPAAAGVGLRLVGGGQEAYVERLRRLAAEQGVTERVRITGPVPSDRVLETVRSGGFGLCLIQPICMSYELTLPNKLFEYVAAGLPVLASDLPVIGPIVSEHGLGEVVPPADLPRIAAAMAQLAGGEDRLAAIRTFAAGHTWESERDRLAEVYASLRPARRSASSRRA